MNSQHYLKIAQVVSEAGSCLRRKVGCILVNDLGHIIATGRNGPPRGFMHCDEKPCEGSDAQSGTDLSKCLAIHAEINALIQCVNTQDIYACYVTVSPCRVCIKALLNTSCGLLYFIKKYPHLDALNLWEYDGQRRWFEVDMSHRVIDGLIDR